MGYEYRGRAKKKKTGTNDTIMIMCPSLATQYYTTLIQFITQEAQEHGLYTLIAYTNRSKEREEYYLNMASDTGFYGIIYTYAPRAVSSLNHLYEKLPLVLINDHNPDLKMELLADIAPGYDHITAAIGGAVAAMSGAAFLCYVTPAEHLALPNVEDVKQGIVASKIAAHAADIAKGIPHARDIDDKMGDARRVLDWDAQFACALDPETAKAIRDARLPEDDHSDTCSMCGKFCAVRSMNKALAGEYIDIL